MKPFQSVGGTDTHPSSIHQGFEDLKGGMLYSHILLAILVACDNISAAPLKLNGVPSTFKQESNNSTELIAGNTSVKLLKPTTTIMFGALVPYRAFSARRFNKAIITVIDDMKNYPRIASQKNSSSNVNYKVGYQIVNIKHNPSPTDILKNLCEEFLAYNVSAIIYATNFETYGSSTASAQYFLQLAAYLGIPVIGWHADNSGLERPASQSTLQLQLAPSLEQQTTAMLSILQRYKWHQFSVVTSQIAGHDDFIQAIREQVLHSQYKLRIIDTIIVSVLTDLNRLVGSETRIMLLYSTRSEAKQILSHASKLKLTGVNYLWLATQSVLGSSKDAPIEFPIGMLGVHFGTDDDSLLEWLSRSTRVFLRGLEHYLSTGLPSSLVPNISCQENSSVKWANGEHFYRHLRNVTLVHNASGQPIVQFNSDGRSRITELQIMNLRPATMPGLTIWEEVGIWKSKEGLDIKDILWPGNSHTPPQGVPEKFHLKITFLEEPPYINVAPPDQITGQCGLNKGIPCRMGTISEENDSNRNGSIYQCCSGFCIDLLEKFADDLAFTYELFRVEDGKWGAKTNEKWNGLVAALINGKADMVMTSLKINFERSQAIDFSLPFLDTGIAIVVAKRTGIISPTAFLEPFDSAMWMLVALVAIHVAALTIFLFEWLSPYGFDAQVRPSEHRFSLCRTLWLVWAVLFQAAVNVDCPRGYTARCVANVWAMFALIFLAIYTANLAAFMITREEFHHLTGINDTKLNNPHTLKPPFRFGTIPHGNTDAVLRRNFPLMHAYMRRYTKNNVTAGVQAVKEGLLDAFIYDATVLDYLVGQDSECVLLTVGSWFAMTGYGVGFPRNSKYKALINHQLMEYRENGDLERLQRFWFTGACNKPTSKEKQSRSDPLALEQFFSTFLLLGSGILLAVILLFLEHLYCNYIIKIRCRGSGVPIKLTRASNCCSLISRSVGSSLRPIPMRKKNKIYTQKPLYQVRECHTALVQLREALTLAQSRVAQLEAEVALKEETLPDASCLLHGPSRLRSSPGWRWLPQTRISPRSPGEFFSASCDELYNSHHESIRRHQVRMDINEIAEIETVL